MMKKLTILFILLLSHSICKAPETKSLTIFAPVVIMDQRYEVLIKALTWVETKHGKKLINPIEQAYGWFQIRPIRLRHYNRLNGTNYKIEDCLDYELSKKIFLYFTNHDSSGKVIPYKSWEQAAKDWNGSGPMTIAYWKLIQSYLRTST